MARPATIAPRIESKPPSTSTGKAFSTISDRENCTPSRAPQRRPATSATKPAAVQTTPQITGRRRPTASAASWSSATARKARPMRVKRKNAVSPATIAPAIAAATRSKVET